MRDSRYRFLPVVSSLAEQFTMTVAPASAWRMLGGFGTHTSSQISAATARPAELLTSEQQICTEMDIISVLTLLGHPHVLHFRISRCEMTKLVEFSVVGNMYLRHQSQQMAAANGRRHIVELAVLLPGQTHENQRVQIRRLPGDMKQLLSGTFQQKLLQK